MNALVPATTLVPALSSKQRTFPPQKPNPPQQTTSFSYKDDDDVNNNKTQKQKPKLIQNHHECTTTDHLSTNWPHLLNTSIRSRDFVLGKAIHAHLVKVGRDRNLFEGNNLVNFYVKFGEVEVASKVFDGMREKNVITWTSLIKGYVENGDCFKALNVAFDMHRLGENLNEHSCAVILQACRSVEDRIFGEQIHGLVVKNGFEENVVVGSSLVSMYSKGGNCVDAEKVFSESADKDVRCFNFMILEYGKAGYGAKAIGVFIDLLISEFEPNDYTFTNVISVCNGEEIGFSEGMQLHGLAVKSGYLTEITVGNAVVSMYGKNGMVKEAETMFCAMDEWNLISWTALISAYTKNCCSVKAIDGFLQLLGTGVDVDCTLLATVLDCCSESKNLDLGVQIHGLATKLSFTPDLNVGTALIDFYCKCMQRKSAGKVFHGLCLKNTASFNAFLDGFVDNHEIEENPMALFTQMRLAGLRPDYITFSRLLSFSANETSLETGRCLHAYVTKAGFESNTTVSNAVITMYAKCGNAEEAYRMFSLVINHDLVSWNSIISAFAIQGQGQKALSLFEEMKKNGSLPDGVTMLVLLQACAYSGLFRDGVCLFNEMEPKYGIQPSLSHCASMVDLLGRAGDLSEAMESINRSPFPDSTLLWRTLVNVCKLYGDIELGKLASKHLLDLSPDESGSYVLVSNLYAGEGIFDEAVKVRTTMNELNFRKEAGISWIEIGNKVHRFVASDKSHPESWEIFTRLDLLKKDMSQTYCVDSDILRETVYD